MLRLVIFILRLCIWISVRVSESINFVTHEHDRSNGYACPLFATTKTRFVAMTSEHNILPAAKIEMKQKQTSNWTRPAGNWQWQFDIIIIDSSSVHRRHCFLYGNSVHQEMRCYGLCVYVSPIQSSFGDWKFPMRPVASAQRQLCSNQQQYFGSSSSSADIELNSMACVSIEIIVDTVMWNKRLELTVNRRNQ